MYLSRLPVSEMNLRKVRKIFEKDALDLFRTRARMIAIFLFPMLMIFFLGAGFGGQVAGINTVVTVESSQSPSSQAFLRAIQTAENNSDLLNVTINPDLSKEEARKKMEQGKYDAFVYVPAGFDLNSPSSENIEILVSPEKGQQVKASVLEGVKTIVSRLKGGIPPVVASESYGNLDYIDFLAPAIIVMTIFFGAGQGTGRALAGEKEEGTLDRLAMTPATANDIIAGKTLYASSVQLIRSLIIILAVTFLFGVTMNGSWFLVGLIVLLMTIASVGIGLVLSAISEDEATYSEISLMVVLPAIFVTGIFYPVSAMPSWIQSLAYVYPLSYANTAMRKVMLLGAGLGDIVYNLVMLLVIAVILYFAGVFLFNKTARG